MELVSSFPCCLQHTNSGVPYICFTWWVLVLTAHSWQNPYFTVSLNHCKVLSKKDIHSLLQPKTSPPKSWPRCRWGHMLRGWLKLKPTPFLFAASAHSCVSAGHLRSSFSLDWEWLFKESLQIIPAHLRLLSKTGNKKKPLAGPLSLYSFCVSGPIKGPELGSTPAPQHLGHPCWLKNPLKGFPSWILAHLEHVYAETCIAMQLLFQGYHELSRCVSRGFHIFLHPL